jgi:hypothetical protein
MLEGKGGCFVPAEDVCVTSMLHVEFSQNRYLPLLPHQPKIITFFLNFEDRLIIAFRAYFLFQSIMYKSV